MSDSDILAMLTVDLGLTTEAYNDRLTQIIASAKAEIEREGVILDTADTAHCQLIVMYAAWLWRNRDTQTGMPRMVRYALNNLILSQKMGGEAS